MLCFGLLVAALAVCQGLPSRLRTDEKSNLRITGGQTADIKDYPHQIALFRDDSLFCGGSILNEKWVLTAAHCIAGLDGYVASVLAGSTSLRTGGQRVNVTSATAHPRFNAGTYTYDVGMLRLSEPLKLDGVSTRAIKLVAPGTTLAAGQFLSISGWGRIARYSFYVTSPPGLLTLQQTNSTLPDKLRAVMVASMPMAVCSLSYTNDGYYIDDTMVCAAASDKDSCGGDSGGALVNDLHIQVGVVSWGVGCAVRGYPGIYTNLAHPDLQRWIVEMIRFND